MHQRNLRMKLEGPEGIREIAATPSNGRKDNLTIVKECQTSNQPSIIAAKFPVNFFLRAKMKSFWH